MEIRVDGPELIRIPPGNFMVVYRERGGTRFITVGLNIFSLHHMNIAMSEVETHRPPVHKLLANCINTLTAGLEKVVIDKFDSQINVYHSHIYVRDRENNELLAIDAHVTDALIVAIIEKCAVYVTEDVLNDAGEARKQYGSSEGKAKNIFENTDWDKVPKA